MVREYFTACEQQFPEHRADLRRISLALRRGGVKTMSELCQMYTRCPESLLQIRSVGEKSVGLIGELCMRYAKTTTKQEETQ